MPPKVYEKEERIESLKQKNPINTKKKVRKKEEKYLKKWEK